MKQAIGVFDSGLGGLTVVKALLAQLPDEDIIYFGDTARVPYGSKSRDSIIRFSQENAEVLLAAQVKMIVVACNSSSSFALPLLRQQTNVPVMGVIKPGVRKALSLTQSKRIGVIATAATIQSQKYTKLLQAQDPEVIAFSQACPLFVPLVEEGWTHKAVTTAIAQEYLKPLQEVEIDTLILGCTHYPLLKSVIQKVMGARVTLVDSAQVVAQEVEQYLDNGTSLRAHQGDLRRVKLIASDKPQNFERMARNFLGTEVYAETEITFQSVSEILK